jgi:CheY-like chemotaxis protein
MQSKPVYALVSDLFFASKIVKTGQSLGVEVRAFDTADRLVQASREKGPALVILDCERSEHEAFRALESFRSESALLSIPRIGYLSHTAQELKREMRTAGCEQVYVRSEFTKELQNILMRYTGGFSSRV